MASDPSWSLWTRTSVSHSPSPVRLSRLILSSADRIFVIAVGDLRFVPPQDAVYPNSTFEATSHPPACLQSPNEISGSNYSEDCLYLNVFTPAGANAQTAWLPVMVWMYVNSLGTLVSLIQSGAGSSADYPTLQPRRQFHCWRR